LTVLATYWTTVNRFKSMKENAAAFWTYSIDADTTVYVRDARGLVTLKTDDRGEVTTFTYDAVGNRRRDTTPAAARVATYAATSNRITGMTQNGAALRSYTYDGAGNIITDTRPGEVFAYSYNAADLTPNFFQF
jgi:YD repeat-containing protein